MEVIATVKMSPPHNQIPQKQVLILRHFHYDNPFSLEIVGVFNPQKRTLTVEGVRTCQTFPSKPLSRSALPLWASRENMFGGVRGADTASQIGSSCVLWRFACLLVA